MIESGFPIPTRPGEGQNVVLNVILGVIAVLVACGRFVVAPF